MVLGFVFCRCRMKELIYVGCKGFADAGFPFPEGRNDRGEIRGIPGVSVWTGWPGVGGECRCGPGRETITGEEGFRRVAHWGQTGIQTPQN